MMIFSACASGLLRARLAASRPCQMRSTIAGRQCRVREKRAPRKPGTEVSSAEPADLVVAALGRPGFLTADMVKEGAIVIDVGITRVPDATRKSGFRLKGDVDFEAVAPKCSFITPVPGGVGPMTIAALLKNTYTACKLKNG